MLTGRKELIEKWLKEDKLECTEDYLRDLLCKFRIAFRGLATYSLWRSEIAIQAFPTRGVGYGLKFGFVERVDRASVTAPGISCLSRLEAGKQHHSLLAEPDV